MTSGTDNSPYLNWIKTYNWNQTSYNVFRYSPFRTTLPYSKDLWGEKKNKGSQNDGSGGCEGEYKNWSWGNVEEINIET